MVLPATFFVLLNFGFSESYNSVISSANDFNEDHQQCQDRYLWDPIVSKCRPIYCSSSSFEDEDCFNPTSDDQLNWVLKMDVIHMTLFGYTESDAIQDPLTQYEICDIFPKTFSDFFAIKRHRITNVSIALLKSDRLLRHNNGDQSQVIAIEFDLDQAESINEPMNDVIVAKIVEMISRDNLVTVTLSPTSGIPIELVGIDEKPKTIDSNAFTTWCRY